MGKDWRIAYAAGVFLWCGASNAALAQYNGAPSILRSAAGVAPAGPAAPSESNLALPDPVSSLPPKGRAEGSGRGSSGAPGGTGNGPEGGVAPGAGVGGRGIRTDVSLAAARQANTNANANSNGAGEGLTDAQKSLLSTGTAAVTVKPGVTNIFPVSLGHVNRIATPFHKAGVRTEASSGVEVSQNVIYVTPTSDTPISLLVTEDGDETTVLSITLVPRLIPPVVLTLQLPADPGGTAPAPGDNLMAANFERSEPYVDVLRDLLRGLAVNTIPTGYDLEQNADLADAPRCQDSPVPVDFARGQKIVGSGIEVDIGVVKNTAATPLEFNESWCNQAGVMAVAINPTPVIEPGASDEIYVAERIVPPADGVVARPSLVAP